MKQIQKTLTVPALCLVILIVASCGGGGTLENIKLMKYGNNGYW